MALSTTTYGYIIDPLVPLTDTNGETIRNGYVKVFVAGTSTPVITYANFDGTANQERIELDNSGRPMTGVIGLKSSLYKICVYDEEHSQETPILTVDKVQVNGASVTTSANIVQGLNDVSGSGWVKASVADNEAQVEMDPSSATEVGISDFPSHDQDIYGVFLDSEGNPYKILLGDLSSSVFLGSGATMGQVYQLVTSGKTVSISMVDPNDSKNIITLHLATKRSDGMDRTMTFSSPEYDNKFYEIKYESSDGGTTWTSSYSVHAPAIIEGAALNTPPDGTKVLAAYNEGKIPVVKILTGIGKYQVYTMNYADTYGATYRRFYFNSITARNGTENVLKYESSNGGTSFTADISQRKYTPREAIAGDYDTTGLTEYNTGDLVFHEDGYGVNGLFRCNEDEVSGSWKASKWTSTTVAAELKRLASLI